MILTMRSPGRRSLAGLIEERTAPPDAANDASAIPVDQRASPASDDGVQGEYPWRSIPLWVERCPDDRTP